MPLSHRWLILPHGEEMHVLVTNGGPGVEKDVIEARFTPDFNFDIDLDMVNAAGGNKIVSVPVFELGYVEREDFYRERTNKDHC